MASSFGRSLGNVHMRRLTTALFALIAAAGLAHAGGSNDEIARKDALQAAKLAAQDTVNLRQLTDGQFGPMRVTAITAGCDSTDPDLIIHDDGQLENGYGYNANATEGYFVDRFTPAAYPATVTTVCVAFITNAGIASLDIDLQVWADDGAGGTPGTLLGSKAVTVHPASIAGLPATAVFEEFDLSDLGIAVTSGSPYIGIRAPGMTGWFVASDESTSTPLGEGMTHANDDPWESIPAVPGATGPAWPNYRSLMVRAAMPAAGPGAPSLGKAFAPAQVMAGEDSVLTITLRNTTQPTAATLSADLVDELPDGLVISASPGVDTTCGGAPVANAGGDSITLPAGSTIPAEGTCTISVNVTSAEDGTYLNTIPAGALQTQHGNNASPATASLKVGYVFPEPYCAVDFPSDVEPITKVTFGSIDNASSATINGSPALEDFTGVNGTVIAGTTVSMAVEGNTNGSFTTVVKVFIDWNQDGNFDDATEGYLIGNIQNSTGLDGKQAVNDIEIPVDATPGPTRMRVTKKFNTAATPCNTSGYGQAEDYTLTVGAPILHTVTSSVGSGDGTITPAGAQSVYENATASFVLLPGAGYKTSSVSGSCGGTLDGNAFETDPVTADCDVIANFELASLTLSKTFEPELIDEHDTSTAIITIGNPTLHDATLQSALVDNLPAGLTATSATTTCGLILGKPAAAPLADATSITLPAGVVLPAGSSCEIRATVHANPGTYVNTLAAGALDTDQGQNEEVAEATLVVTGTPVIEITPEEVSASLVTNTTTTQTLTIANTGTDTLDYTIDEAPAPRDLNPPSFKNLSGMNHDASGAALSSGAGLGSARAGQAVVLAEMDISQMADNTPGDEGVSCGTQSTSTADNSWWRRFYFNEHAGVGSSTSVSAVTISTGSIDIPGGVPGTINLYTLPHSTAVDTIPTSALTLIGTASFTATGSLSSITVPVEGAISDTAGNDLVVEWHTDGNAAGGQFFPGANATAETHPTFLSSATCGIDAPTKAINVGNGFPDFHLTMVVTLGGSAGAASCQNIGDVSWLSASPDSGSLAAGDDDEITVGFDANLMAPGTYNAALCVASNDPENPVVAVPVSMEVQASGETFTVTPSVASGDGTISPDTAQTVDENASVSFTLTPALGQQIASVGGTCTGTLDGDTFTTGPVTEDCTVEANFEPIPFPWPYCDVTYTNNVEPISRVVFTGIDNASSPTVNGTPPLEDFLDVAGGQVSQGGVYEMAVEGNTDGNYTAKIRVYVDWNQNGVFDANEGTSLSDLVGSTGTDGQQSTGEIQVPADALLGATRMRVLKKFSTPADPCNTAGFGQAEDYTIVVDNNPLPVPSIAVDAFSLEFTAETGQEDTGPMEVSNVGEAGSRLEYNIKRALPERPAASSSWISRGDVFRTMIADNDRAKRRASGIVSSLGGNPMVSQHRAGLPVVLAASDISQMQDNSPGDEGVSCGTQATDTADNSWWRRFYFSEHPEVGASTQVTSVTVSSGSISIPGGLPITINLYTIPHSVPVDTIDTAQLTLIGTANATITDALASITVPVEGVVDDTAGMDLVVEYHTDGNGAGGQFFPGANASPETHPTFLSSAECGITDPTEAANVGDGFPDFHLTMVVSVEDAGPPGVGCDNPSNVPWLAASPTSGTIMQGDSQLVAVTANASGLDVGTYEALLCVSSNDPAHPRLDIPVTFEVTPTDIIFQDGFDGGSTPGVYTDLDSFTENFNGQAYSNSFDELAPSVGDEAAISYSDDATGIAYTIDSEPSPNTLWFGDGVVSTDGSGAQLVIKFTGAPVTAVGFNAYASDIDLNPIPGNKVVITLSDGTEETFNTTGTDDFRGFISAEPITKVTIDAPNPSDPTDSSWSSLDNLVVGTEN